MASNIINEDKMPTAKNVSAVEYDPKTDDLVIHNHSFGYFSYKPLCLQRFCRPRWFLFWISLSVGLQSLIEGGLLPVIISTLEQRFSLSSSESGFIASCYEIATLICCLPVSYIGATRHKPRILGLGMVLAGIGAFVFSLPHFATDYYSPTFSNDSEYLCGNTSLHNLCAETQDSSLASYKYVFYLGFLLIGAGSVSLFTLGLAFLDDNVRPKVVSVYLGIFYMMVILGHALGFVFGGWLLLLYVDAPGKDPEEFNLTPSSSAWIGAWWIGFFAGSFLCWILSLPLFGMPFDLPGAEEARAERINEVHKKGDDAEVTRPGFGKSYKDVPKAFKNLMSNPTFMFLNLAGATEGMLIGGFTLFWAKYIEVQFMLTAGVAAMIIGLLVVPAGGGSSFLSGWLVKRFKMSCQDTIKFCWAVSFSAIFFCLAFLLECKQGPVAGFTDIDSNTEMNLTRPCNMDCMCTEANYNPVCGNDAVNYYSPCHAGCKVRFLDDESDLKMYGHCACIEANTTYISGFPADAVDNFCATHCEWKLVVFLALLFIVFAQTFGCIMPALSATIRAVAPKQRSFALGNQSIYIRLLGSVPAPLLFGKFIDLSCQQWSHSCTENSKGSCHFYNNHKMAISMLALGVSLKTLSAIFFFFAWWLYKPPVDHSKSEDMPESDSTQNNDNKNINSVSVGASEYMADSGAVSADYVTRL